MHDILDEITDMIYTISDYDSDSRKIQVFG